MRFRHPVNYAIYLILKAICRVDAEDLKKIPAAGPLIIVTNHINFLEIPVLYVYLLPRRLVGISKVETWRNPVLRYLADLWDTIPIRRNAVDSSAFTAARRALGRERILVVAPEGTRSRDGRLRRAHAGVVVIAAGSGAPVLPVAHFGGERFWGNIRSLRKTRVHIKVGSPIRIDPARITNRRRREEAITEIMRALAALLPEAYRGYYG